MVAFLDRSVATGKAPSRAALVASAVEREMRRPAAEQDAQVLRTQGAADELDDLVEWTGVSSDNVLTVPVDALGRTVGSLSSEQETQPARAVVLAYDLEVPLLD